MSSSTYSYPMRTPPPMRPSRSLEGLEQVIPPRTPLTPCSPVRSELLFLNKPLPAKPLPETPPENIAIWSDSSDSESTVDDSVGGPSEPRDSIESYPIFVSSGSDDFAELVDHPSPSADPHQKHRHLPSPPRSHPWEDLCSSSADSAASPIAAESSLISDAQYGRLYNCSQNRPGTNHYFREKKWDFFPELAPSAVQAGSRTMNAQVHNAKRRKKEGRLHLSALDFSKGRRRWHSLDRLPHVRDSIKTYVHRTLSKGSTEDQPKNSPRPATAPMGSPYARSSSHRSEDTIHRLGNKGHSSLDVSVQMRELSISATHSSTSTFCESPHLATPMQRQKPLAVPLSPYQKYGATIWETPKKSKKRHVRFPTHHQHRTALRTSPSALAAKPLSSLSPPLRMQLQQALQDGTGHVLVALDGAKKRITESKEDRRREHLKSQIRLVGSVDPHTCVEADPWD